MLTAVKNDGTPFSLLPRLPKEKLRRLREDQEFQCPECKEKVMMKIGTQRMEHFAHQKGSLCVESYERESEYHLAGKLQLFQWLVNQNLCPELEPFYSSIRQRPDIGVLYDKKNLALEYQCSTIPPELMMKRTKQYQLRKMIPFWIMGGKNIKRKGEKKVSLSNFDYLFLTKSPAGQWLLPAYCSTLKTFILLRNITPLSSRNALTQFLIIPMQQIDCEQLLNPSPIAYSFNSADWKKEIRSQKSNIHLQGYHQNEFLREMYQASLNCTLLPSFIGLPVPNAPVIETAPLIWQAYVFKDHLHQKKAGEILTFSMVFRSFMQRVHKSQIKLRTLPLVPQISPTLPLAEYLHLLVRLDVLELLNPNTFRIKRKLIVQEHLVLQLEMEDAFYKEFAPILFS
jgi:competence protein CoiA